MFGFGSTRKTSHDNDIFDVAEVQELTQTFPQKTSLGDDSMHDPSELVKLVSGEGFIIRSAVSRSLENELGKKNGRLHIETLASSLDVAPEELLRIINQEKTTFFSKDESSILTRPELKTIIQQLQSKADEMFVPATIFADASDMDRKDLIRLAETSGEFVKDRQIQLLHDPQPSSPSSESASYPYIHTLSLLLKTQKSLTEKMDLAQGEAK